MAAAITEDVDALRTLGVLDLLDREQLREGLAAVTVKNQTHRRAYDELFDLYFPARPGGDQAAADGATEGDDDAFLRDVIQRLLDGDEAAIRQMARRAVERFGRVEGRDGEAQWFQYRVFRAVDLQELLARMLRERLDETGAEATALQQRLWRDEFEARLRAFREEVEAEVRRRAAERRGVAQVAARLVRPPLEDVDFFRLGRDEQAELRRLIHPLARKLAARMAVKRRHGRDGRLDVRRTVRRSLGTGGVPFDPAMRPRRPHRPELFLVCDVSGSVAAFARFTLMLVHALQAQFGRVRSFAFVDTLDEVTSYFAAGDVTDAIRRMMEEADLVWLDGHSDYGHSLERFHERFAREVTPRSSIVVLGDARNNYRQPNAWVLRDLQHRARRVYWLNPEPANLWDSGDSIASSYARFTDEMVEVRNLRQLAGFIERLT